MTCVRFQNDHAAMGLPMAVPVVLFARELAMDATLSKAQPPMLKAEEASPLLDAAWRTPNFGSAFALALEYSVGKTLADVKIVKGPPPHELLKSEGDEADRGRARPALTKGQCDLLCEGLQLGYRWVPWRPLVPWWDVEYHPENPGQLVLLAPRAKASLGPSAARTLPSGSPFSQRAFLSSLWLLRGAREHGEEGPLERGALRSAPRSEGELTRGGAPRDDLYRATRIDYQYASGDDAWTSPFKEENDGVASSAPLDPRRALPSPHVEFSKRILRQTYDYDWLGNTDKTTDDANGFYDRSLGAVTNDGAANKPYQLKSATLSGARGGTVRAKYDDAGHMVRMDLARSGPCLPTGATCSQRFAYDWDEVGRLSRARRWDTAPGSSIDDPLPGGTPAADLRHHYDAGDQRVIKHAVDTSGESFTLYVFASLELRRSQFGTAYSDTGSGPADYEASVFTVVPYLLANGVRLARLAYEGTSEVPEVATGTGAGQVNASVSQVHVFFELGDHLGSTSVVLDKATSEIVERSTFQGYGATESDYRPGRWNAFREDYRFTGKEEDAEVGLTYFGKRYLNAYLGRWISADPLAIHAPGEADLNVYAYVSGSILKNVDPLELEEEAASSDEGQMRAASAQEALSDTGHEDISYNREVYVGVSGDPDGKVASEGGSGFFRRLLGVAVAVGTLGVGLASKDIREMISGVTQQKAHMPPAGGYNTLEQAQTFRNMELAHLSERDGVEYSSATYQQGGRYYFTAPRAGTQGSAEPPHETAVPRNAIMTDYAHSHPVTLGDPVKGATAGYDAQVHGQDIMSALDGFRELSSIHNVHKDYTETVVHRVRVESNSAAPARKGDLVWTSSTLRVGEMVRSGQWKWNSRSSDVPEEMYERP